MDRFQQVPPALGNQYEDDRVLRSYLARVCSPEVLSEIEPSLLEMGRLAGGELYELQLADRLNVRPAHDISLQQIAVVLHHTPQPSGCNTLLTCCSKAPLPVRSALRSEGFSPPSALT